MSKNKVERDAQKRNIMNEAWAIVRRTGKGIAEAMVVAWRNFKLRIRLAVQAAVRFVYMKKDGTVREAVGTLLESAINYVANGRGRPTPGHLQLYWDVECQGYRCFDKANLMTVM